MLKIVSWNIARSDDAWRSLLDSDADIALLQEASNPPADVSQALDIDPAPWWTAGAGLTRPWRAAIVRISDRVDLQWIEPRSIENAEPGDLAISRMGAVAAAIVTTSSAEPLVVASLYAPWERPHVSAASSWIYADGSAHRLISDLSTFIGQQESHRIIAAGDLNILHGYGEHGSEYWAHRYQTVFDRMSTLGIPFIGPQAPDGRLADPWPDELPRSSRNVPTYHTNHQAPDSASRQLDFVFASRGLSDRVRVRALNAPENWGPSDHCRVEIDVE